MEYQALQQELKDLETRKAELEQAIQAQRGQRKKELRAEIQARLEEEGFSLAELCPETKPKKRSKSGPATAKNYAVFALKEDPSLTYTRGPIPSWMREKMEALGLDSTSKEDRERFKTEQMMQLQS